MEMKIKRKIFFHYLTSFMEKNVIQILEYIFKFIYPNSGALTSIKDFIKYSSLVCKHIQVNLHELLIYLYFKLPHIFPQIPFNASISRTRCPFPIPPKDGLHDISPIVVFLCVTISVGDPALADIDAASVPACPPPTTITYNLFSTFFRFSI